MKIYKAYQKKGKEKEKKNIQTFMVRCLVLDSVSLSNPLFYFFIFYFWNVWFLLCMHLLQQDEANDQKWIRTNSWVGIYRH